MRIAAIDIGTNSLHMIVVQVRPDQSFEVIDREKEMVRLGSGGLGGRALTDSAMTTALQVLSKFRRLAESSDVDEIVAAATSAVREADNGREFLNAVRQRTGIRVRVISGTEEARYIHRAAVYGVDVAGGSAVVVDIGGGSVELTRGTASHVQVAHSAKIGVIRLTEQFVRSDPISQRDVHRLTKCIRQEIAGSIEEISVLGFDRVIGTSGTILSLGALAAGDGRALGSDDLRNRRISAKQVRRVRRDMTSLALADRLRIPGLDPRRADLAVAGSVLLDTVLKMLGARELTLCDLALREGLALDYIRKNKARIAKVEKYPDVRRRSVIELAERCNYWPEHSQQVCRIALQLFDQTQTAHGLDDRAREWLEFGALLHDVGVHISYGRHHKHSYYLIKNGDLRGFEPDEVEVMALVARYHRRGLTKRSHEGYGGLPTELRRIVKTLSAILRVAESLDRSHQQSVASVEVIAGGQDYLLRLTPAGDTELEVWAAQRSAAPLEQALRRIVRVEVASNPARRSQSAARAHRKTVRGRGQRRVRKDETVRASRSGRPPAAATCCSLSGARRHGSGPPRRDIKEIPMRALVIVMTLLGAVAATPAAQESPPIAPGSTVERIATGFGFLEGPAADADGTLYFTDIPNNRIHRWTPGGGVATFMDESGGANGLRFDLDGNLLVCQMGARQVTAISPGARASCWRSTTTATGSTVPMTCGWILRAVCTLPTPGTAPRTTKRSTATTCTTSPPTAPRCCGSPTISFVRTGSWARRMADGSTSPTMVTDAPMSTRRRTTDHSTTSGCSPRKVPMG